MGSPHYVHFCPLIKATEGEVDHCRGCHSSARVEACLCVDAGVGYRVPQALEASSRPVGVMGSPGQQRQSKRRSDTDATPGPSKKRFLTKQQLDLQRDHVYAELMKRMSNLCDRVRPAPALNLCATNLPMPVLGVEVAAHEPCFQRSVVESAYDILGPVSPSSARGSIRFAGGDSMPAVMQKALQSLWLDVPQQTQSPPYSWHRHPSSEFSIPECWKHLEELHSCWDDTGNHSRFLDEGWALASSLHDSCLTRILAKRGAPKRPSPAPCYRPPQHFQRAWRLDKHLSPQRPAVDLRSTICVPSEKCVHVHWHLPYRWQVLDIDGVTWTDLPNMEEIEKAYCDPASDWSAVDQASATGWLTRLRNFGLSQATTMQSVDFQKMTCNGASVRRQSTASSVAKASHFNLTTKWLWYWQDDVGQWQEFGQSDVNTPASLTSEALENIYLVDRKTHMTFTAGKQQYVIYFQNTAGGQQMYQVNTKYSTRREVRRRPLFVSCSDMDVVSRKSLKSLTEECPPHWDKNALPDIGYKLVPLPKSTEYNRIECLFKATMPKSTIWSIRRIQNPSLWTRFQLQREQMKKRNKGKPVIEQYLFHGTSNSLIAAICEQNFDWRMSGIHGTAYGKGSYFAKQASYSNEYAKASGGKKSMFVALVLVGDYTKGYSQYARPPAKGTSTTLYDSCVDDEMNPNIFVIFESHQIYPEYVIDYTG
ncbi:protein mono-ADP-ribosyltransferase PARP12 isoform X1 [Festucalex cinctus]